MKKQKRNSGNHKLHKALFWPTALLSLGLPPAGVMAQVSSALQEEVIVTARRKQESAQDVPISITVFNQGAIDKNNIVSATDLTEYVPSLAANTRFGPDQPSFAIRGFTQELRTTASVGFYFAEVVAPRGGGSVTAGDGGGPGAFFDLENVQVLKGPQGTLFGRNTTGGAILLTPQKPTDQLEGYLEGSAGDYDMRRMQGVINVPMGDRVRARFGVDTMERDGHLDNQSGIGPGELGDIDYLAARASLVVDVTDSVENYTVVSYSDSENKGVVSSLFACKPTFALFNAGCPEQLEHQGDDFYSLESNMPDPSNDLEQWQAINTTAWEVNDSLTIKNILSYAELENTLKTKIYGINYDYYGRGNYSFVQSDTPPGMPVNSQTSFVEELQFQGTALDDRLSWQAGLYYENSEPDGETGTASVNNVYCDSIVPNDPAASTCVDVSRHFAYLALGGVDIVGAVFGPEGYGSLSSQIGEIEYTNKAVYSEVSYDISEQWKVTAGLRYTDDEVEGEARAQVWNAFPWRPTQPDGSALPGQSGTAAPGLAPTKCYYADSGATLANGCTDSLGTSSDAVTGLLDFDYFLSDDVMLYAKYSRGYRMGSLNLFGGVGLREFGPEEVDAYELGAKTSFGGPVPGMFNVALFYNELDDQQLQYGYLAPGLTPTTVIANTGSSTIQGLEIESSFMLLDDLTLNISYTYLDTKLDEAAAVAPPDPRIQITATSLVGGDLTFSPEHSLMASLDYRLPLPAEIGDVSVGATYSYTDDQYSTAPEYTNNTGRLAGSPYALLPDYDVLNLNMNWIGIMGSNFDASLFMTNALDEEYTTYVAGLYHSMGFETRMVGTPKMWGARLRYNFGK
jgi:iron complex outermembrane receptor protein